MRAIAAAMAEDVRVVAAGVLQGIGEDGKSVEGAIVVDTTSERDNGGSEPGGVGGDGAEGIAHDAAEETGI
jgi:hypothetical protein